MKQIILALCGNFNNSNNKTFDIPRIIDGVFNLF